MTEEPVAQQPFKDRTVGLIVFGLFEILGGLLSLSMVVFVLAFATLVARRPEGAPPLPTNGFDLKSSLTATFSYLGIAAVLIALGVGSMLCRRWARSLSLILGWAVLFFGVYLATLLAMMRPYLETMMAARGSDTPGLPDLVLVLMIAVPLLALTVPGVGFILFYRSENVRATCEYKDPIPRWTDRRPLPIVALTLLIGSGVLTPLTLTMSGGMLLVFGFDIRGPGAILLTLVIAAVSAWAAWRVWQLDVRGWWVDLLLSLGFGLSTLYAMSSRTRPELYGETDLSPEQLEAMAEFAPPASLTTVPMALFLLVLLAFFIYTKRFFPARAVDTGSDAV